MFGELARATAVRFGCGALGGVVLPGLVVLFGRGSVVAGVAIFALTLAGELAERHLFFIAATAPRMPGGLR